MSRSGSGGAEDKLAKALKDEALSQVPAGKPEPETLADILKRAKDGKGE